MTELLPQDLLEARVPVADEGIGKPMLADEAVCQELHSVIGSNIHAWRDKVHYLAQGVD